MSKNRPTIFLSAPFVDDLIDLNRKGIFYCYAFTGVLLILGLGIIAAALCHSSPVASAPIKEAQTLGGGFVASLSALPTKDILARWERVGVLRLARGFLSECAQEPRPPTKAETANLTKILDTIVSKMGG